MKHVFIINPTAGKNNKTAYVMEAADHLRKEHKIDVQCMLTKSPGHATQLARQLAETGEDLRIYACGGDGTINEVANGLIGFDNVAMSCVPIGTGNDFLKNFGSDSTKKFYDLEQLWNGPEVLLDTIDCNGKTTLTIACSGIDARIARDVHKYGQSPILTSKGSYIVSLLVNFIFKGIPTHWKLTLDDQVFDKDFSLIAVCNGRHYGASFKPMAEAKMDDGILNVLVVDGVDRITFGRFASAYSVGDYYKFPKYARSYTPKVIHIESEKEDIVTCMDGEIMVNKEVTMQLSPYKLRFFGPEGLNPNASYEDRIPKT